MTDQKRLIGSGCNVSERDGIDAEMLSGYTFWFVTLTAPSFGAIHRVPKSKASEVVRCACGETHQHGSEYRGTPLNQRWYKYGLQAKWNQASSELFRISGKHLSKLIPDVEWSFAREWQSRGALHFHGIVRVPAGYDQTKTWHALQKMRTYTSGDFSWGKEIDVQAINGDDAGNSVRYMAKVVSYTAKQQGDEGLISEVRRKHYERLDWHAARLICGAAGCRGNGSCTGRAHRSFGYAGQMITRSKGWSLVGLNQSSLVEERKQYAIEHAAQTRHQNELELLSKSWDAERRSEMVQDMDHGGFNEVWMQEVMVGLFGKTAGESSSVSGDVATVN